MFEDPNGKIHRITIDQVRHSLPKKLLPYIAGFFVDSNGIWAALNDNAVDEDLDTHTIHAYSLKELKTELKKVKVF